MADLSTLDVASPGATDPVGEGDDRIRETRSALATSFGGVDGGAGTAVSEHYLKGFHKFPRGAVGARPAAGNAGRIYLNTTDKRIELDTGSAWGLCNAVGVGIGTCTAPAQLFGTSYVDIAGMAVTMDVLTGSRLLITATLDDCDTSAALPTFTYNLLQGATSLRTWGVVITAGRPSSHTLIWAINAPSPLGSSTFKLQVKSSLTGTNVAGRIGASQLIVQAL